MNYIKNFNEFLKNGAVTLVTTKDPDTNVLFFVINEKEHYYIPIVKDTAYYADIPDKYFDTISYLISNLDSIFNITSKVRFREKKLEDFNKEIISPIGFLNGEFKFLNVEILNDLYSKSDFVFDIKKDDFVEGGETVKTVISYDCFKDDKDAIDLIEANDDALGFLKPKSESALSKDLKIYVDLIKSGKANKTFITFAGPTGSGKTIAVRQIASVLGMPLHYIQGNDALTADDLLSHPSIDTKNGGYKRVVGPLLEAFSKGHGVLIDEVNMLSPSAALVFNQFGDDTPFIEDDEGIRYYRHPNFVCFCTLNPGYIGTNSINISTKNRMIITNFPALTNVEITKRLKSYNIANHSHKLSDGFFKTFIELYKFMNIEKNKSSDSFEYSLRTFQRFVDNILIRRMKLAEFKNAIKSAFVDCLNIDNDNQDIIKRIVGKDLYKECVDNLWNEYTFKAAGESNIKDSKGLDSLKNLKGIDIIETDEEIELVASDMFAEGKGEESTPEEE